MAVLAKRRKRTDFQSNSQYVTSVSLATKFACEAAVTVSDVRFEKGFQNIF
jgi:hypothetical protein